jgi:hypothetical protein
VRSHDHPQRVSSSHSTIERLDCAFDESPGGSSSQLQAAESPNVNYQRRRVKQERPFILLLWKCRSIGLQSGKNSNFIGYNEFVWTAGGSHRDCHTPGTMWSFRRKKDPKLGGYSIVSPLSQLTTSAIQSKKVFYDIHFKAHPVIVNPQN